MKIKTLSIALLAGLISLPSAIEPAEAKVEFNLFTVKGFVKSRGFKVDQAFGDKYQKQVKAPFRIYIPIDKKKYRSLAVPPKSPTSFYLKLNFATLDQPPKLIENIQFISMRLPMVDTDQRLKLAADLLRERAFHAAVRGKNDPKILGMRKITIGKLPAVELSGRYIEPSLGPMFLRIVAVPHPDQVDGIISIANIVARFIPLKGADDFKKLTRIGHVMKSFKYLK